jgi:hypothetical protein
LGLEAERLVNDPRLLPLFDQFVQAYRTNPNAPTTFYTPQFETQFRAIEADYYRTEEADPEELCEGL